MKNYAKVSDKVKQENLLMFTGITLMAAGPVLWFLMQTLLEVEQRKLSLNAYNLLGFFDMGLALFLAVTGGALALAGWGLAAWHAWQDVKIRRGTLP
ncbi:hypothetical protein VL10_14755 [Leclercia adecarboxylata]|nr:hypothetical protein VL10_14755 [Leclercia adecarboxylata]KMN63695.1 hypothetical protein VK95_18530 [Leclercia sp. LK8]